MAQFIINRQLPVHSSCPLTGFLNANPSPHVHARVANYGLMDQMAALHWIQQNIQKFGGDPNVVTLAGHGTGAACINYLMTSPTMVRGLFHRAILMSGSAYSSWALVEDPVLFAIKLAKEVNCTIPDDLNRNHEQIVDCLRDVPLEDLYSADIQAPNFLTSFGPSVSCNQNYEKPYNKHLRFLNINVLYKNLYRSLYRTKNISFFLAINNIFIP